MVLLIFADYFRAQVSSLNSDALQVVEATGLVTPVIGVSYVSPVVLFVQTQVKSVLQEEKPKVITNADAINRAFFI